MSLSVELITMLGAGLGLLFSSIVVCLVTIYPFFWLYVSVQSHYGHTSTFGRQSSVLAFSPYPVVLATIDASQ